MMKFLRELRHDLGFISDGYRTSFCNGLCEIGVQARLGKRGRPEESIHPMGSDGIIDIDDGLIRWVNLGRWWNGGESDSYMNYYGVPDARIDASFLEIRISTIRKRKIPVIGRVVEAYWECKEYGGEIVDRLNNDTSINQTVMVTNDLSVHVNRDLGCWILVDHQEGSPNNQLWRCYQAIAEHLISSPKSV